MLPDLSRETTCKRFAGYVIVPETAFIGAPVGVDTWTATDKTWPTAYEPEALFGTMERFAASTFCEKQIRLKNVSEAKKAAGNENGLGLAISTTPLFVDIEDIGGK